MTTYFHQLKDFTVVSTVVLSSEIEGIFNEQEISANNAERELITMPRN